MSWQETVRERLVGGGELVTRVEHERAEGVNSVWLAARMQKAGPHDST